MAALIKTRKPSNAKSVLIRSKTVIVKHEVLLDNRVEGYLQTVLRPIYLNKTVFFAAKYKLRDNFITPHNNIYYTTGYFICLFLRLYLIYKQIVVRQIFVSNPDRPFYTIVRIIRNVSDFMYFVYGISLLYYKNYKHNQTHISLMLNIQRICRILNICYKSFKNDTIYSWVGVILLNSVWVFTALSFFFCGSNYDVLDALAIYVCCVFDIELLYCIVLIKLLTRVSMKWIKDVQEAVCVETPKSKYWKFMMENYQDMIESYKMIETIFQEIVLLCAFHILFFGVIHMVMILEVVSFSGFHDSSILMNIFLTQLWQGKNLLLIMLISINCERLYKAIKELYFTCTLLKSSVGCSDVQKRFFKKVERVYNVMFHKFSLCGLVLVDASLPLHIIEFVATCTIALLQFYLQ